MSDVLELPRLNLGPSQSSASSATDPSRRGSLRTTHQTKNLERPISGPPQRRLTKRRAASLDLDREDYSRIEDLALHSAKRSGGGDSALEGASPALSSGTSTREQVCLCQPDPKIPRPRNAFILYRQHYQAQVIAQNPGLANPEISKIIGEQWRKQAPEVKSEWQRLAEEEKQRHQRQYPNYRYQPRRAGKTSGLHPISSPSLGDPERCPKCNGRYISTPSTPPTQFGLSSVGLSNQKGTLLPPFTPSRASEPDKPHHLPKTQNSKMDAPRTTPIHPQAHRRGPYPYPSPLHAHNEMDEEMELMSPPPDYKRRRYNQEAQRFNSEIPPGYTSSSPVYYAAPPRFNRNMVPPASAGGYRPQHLPSPGMLTRGGTMGPPVQYSPVTHQRQHFQPQSAPPFDESLRLPPLQTQLSKPTTPATKRLEAAEMESRERRARSLEAMVMTIPYVNKIKVLAKISPPLIAPSPSSPDFEIRGAVVAIDGSEDGLLSETGAFIQEHLDVDTACAVKTWKTPGSSSTSRTSSLTDSEMADANASTPAAAPLTEGQNAFVEYLSIIREWHKKSQEIIKYITTAPSRSAADNSASVSPGSSGTKAFPIALVPGGFSLTLSDDFALRIPINDSYAPVDHWQWMATLWRGIVGPDLTVYVTRAGRDEIAKFGAVEVRSDCAAIIVRISDGAKMDEKMSRRLGFEVTEFVRGLESGVSTHLKN